jgi:Xaa-Pro aminopeptidase
MQQVKIAGDPGRSIPEAGTVHGDAAIYADLLRVGVETGGLGSASEVLASTLADLGLAGGRLAVDDVAVRALLAEQVLPKAELVDGYETFRYIRAVKSPEELDCLRRSTEANDRAMDAMVAAIRPGVSWGELKLECDRSMIEAGALPGFWGSATGPATYRFNLIQTESPALTKKVSEGEIFRLDLGGTYRRYWSDGTRSATLKAKLPDWINRATKTLAAAHAECLEHLRPGVPMGKAIEVYEEVVRREGFPGFQAAWGHGLGLDCYDYPSPRIQRSSKEVFEENMVVNIEGGPAVIGEGQFNYEVTYRITANEPERLSTDTGLFQELG